MTTIDELLVKIDASTELLRRELNKGEAAVGQFERRTDSRLASVEKRFGKLGGVVRTALGAFGVSLGVAGVLGFTKSAIAAADAIGDAAQQAGLGAERFQRLRFAFGQSGLGATEFELALRTSNQRLGEFINNGAGPAAKAIRQLGLEQRIASGEIKNNEQFTTALIQALGNVRDGAQRAALAAQVFGAEAGAKLAAALATGGKAMEEAARQAAGILSDETVQKGSELADSWERIAAAARGFAQSVAVAAAHDFGFLQQPGAEGRLAFLEKIQQRRQAIGFDLSAAEQAELADLRAQIANRANYATGGSMDDFIRERERPDSAAGRLRGMVRIDPNNVGDTSIYGRRPGLGLNRPSVALEALDGLTGVALPEWVRQVESAREIFEQMPDDLKRLSPEWRAAAAALDEYDTGLQRTISSHEQIALSLGTSLRSSLSDAFLGVETNFSDLLRRMAADLAASGLLTALASLIPGRGPVGAFFGTALGGLQKRHSGGPVSAGTPYLVKPQEEVFIPDVAGRVRTIAQSRAAMGGEVTFVFKNEAGAMAGAKSARQTGPGIFEVLVGMNNSAFARGDFDSAMARRYGLRPTTGMR